MAYCSGCGKAISEGSNFCQNCGKSIAIAAEATSPSAAAVQRAESEKNFLAENGVMVSNARFVVEGQTYAMSGITSVKILSRNLHVPER